MDDEKELKQVRSNNSGGFFGLLVLIVIGVLIYNHFAHNYSKPWWNGVQSMKVCATGQNANHYPGAALGNEIGCFSMSVTSDGSKITNLVLPEGRSLFAQNTECGKMDTSSVSPAHRWCNFYDVQDNQWEVTKDLN